MSSRKYNAVGLLGLQSSMQYRTNYFIGMISIVFPLVIQFNLWATVYAQKGEGAVVLGYTYPQMILYSLTTTMSSRFLSTNVHAKIASEIKSGALNRYLVQPVSYPVYRFFSFLGEKIMHYIVNIGVLALGLAIMQIFGVVTITPAFFAIYLVDIIISLVLNFLMFLNLSFLSFWLVDVSRIFGVINILVTIFSGAILPIEIFGDIGYRIIQHFPFFYTNYFLTNILSGKLTLATIGQGVLIQLGWISVLTVIAFIVWRKGLQKYEAVGG